jgi:lipid-A-disaccharide synthase-like uncharacterized protein
VSCERPTAWTDCPWCNLPKGIRTEAIKNVCEILGYRRNHDLDARLCAQVIHLEKAHCSAGISHHAWAMWLVGSLLVGTLAVHRGDIVFIALQVSTLTSAAIILFLAQKYRGVVCEATQPTPRASSPGRVDRPVPARNDRGQDSFFSRSGTLKPSSTRDLRSYLVDG